MKISFYNTFVFCVICFCIVAVFGNKYISLDNTKNSNNEIISKEEAISKLNEEYNAEKINFNSPFNNFDYLEKTVLLDSLLIDTYTKEGKYYVKVIVNNYDEKVNADLICEKSTFDKINKMQNTTFIIAANLKKLNHSQTPYFTETYEEGSYYYKLFDEYILEGECLDFIEVSIFDI